MNNVIRHIEYLVHRHDCVVMPKWGAFIANYKPACYDEKLGLMYPPVRELSFNAEVDYNDGLLATSIARKNAISFSQASRIVEEEISSMKQQLNLDGEISLGKVGRFIRQDEVSVIFEPTTNQSATQNFGFTTLSIRQLSDKVRTDAVNTGRIELPKYGRLSRIGLRAAKIAAVAAIVAGVSLILLRPSLFNRHDDMASIAPVIAQKSVQTSSLPSIEQSKALYITLPHEKSEKEIKADDDNKVIVENKDSFGEGNATKPVDDNKKGLRLNSNDRYCLVVASLPSPELAQKFINENSDIELRMLSKDGKYRIYASTGNTTNEVMEGKQYPVIKARYSDAWVCSMR